jgi:hypothetical protein
LGGSHHLRCRSRKVGTDDRCVGIAPQIQVYSRDAEIVSKLGRLESVEQQRRGKSLRDIDAAFSVRTPYKQDRTV